MSVALMVDEVARKRVLQHLSGIGGAGVEQTAQKTKKQGWTKTGVGPWWDMMVEKMQLKGEIQFSALTDGSSAFAAAKAVSL